MSKGLIADKDRAELEAMLVENEASGRLMKGEERVSNGRFRKPVSTIAGAQAQGPGTEAVAAPCTCNCFDRLL